MMGRLFLKCVIIRIGITILHREIKEIEMLFCNRLGVEVEAAIIDFCLNREGLDPTARLQCPQCPPDLCCVPPLTLE